MRIHWKRVILIILPPLGLVGLIAVLAAPGAAAPIFDCAAVTQSSQAECAALIALYNSTGGDNWFNKDCWLQTTTPCDWYGVGCWGGGLDALPGREWTHPPSYNIYRDADPYSPFLTTVYSSTTGTTWSDLNRNPGPWFYTVAGSDFTVVSPRAGVFPFKMVPGG